MLAVIGVLVRPWRLPEAIWPILASIALTLLSLISTANAGKALMKGTDVYLFLVGMMLLSELARHEGLFDWLAGYAIQRARGSAARLFGLVYFIGTLVTIFLSNDATAVVLTPAVYAAAKKANAQPLPYLFVCAMIANAASFVLPISNPANLVLYGRHMPPLVDWLFEFSLASTVSITVTFLMLRFTQRAHLRADISRGVALAPLLRGGALAGGGIALTAATLLVASSRGWQLGLPAFLAGVATVISVLMVNRLSPWKIAKEISWSVLPLVAGLLIVVEAVEGTGILNPLISWLPNGATQAPHSTALAMGSLVAVLCNLLNNLPLGLIAGSLVHNANLSPELTGAMLLGVDIGPNLSVTGSLATILWLVALRREGLSVSTWQFLCLGCIVMPPALIAALLAFVLHNVH